MQLPTILPTPPLHQTMRQPLYQLLLKGISENVVGNTTGPPDYKRYPKPKTLNYGRQNTLDPTYPNSNALNLILQIPNPASILRPLLGGERTKDLCRQRGYDAVGDFSMLTLRYILQHCDDPSVVNTRCFNSLFALDKLEHLQSTVSPSRCSQASFQILLDTRSPLVYTQANFRRLLVVRP